jgi:ABC-type uncharacterized transport system permease subunit
VIEVIGVQHRLLEGITSGYGFSGIVAALFGGLHPLGLIPASVLFGGLLVGADKMQRAVQVPSALIDAILGLIVLFVVGSAYISKRWAARRTIAAQKALEHTKEQTFLQAEPALSGEPGGVSSSAQTDTGLSTLSDSDAQPKEMLP